MKYKQGKGLEKNEAIKSCEKKSQNVNAVYNHKDFL